MHAERVSRSPTIYTSGFRHTPCSSNLSSTRVRVSVVDLNDGVSNGVGVGVGVSVGDGVGVGVGVCDHFVFVFVFALVIVLCLCSC